MCPLPLNIVKFTTKRSDLFDLLPYIPHLNIFSGTVGFAVEHAYLAHLNGQLAGLLHCAPSFCVMKTELEVLRVMIEAWQ